MSPLEKIVCPLDFSPTSYEALRNAELVARRANAELILVHVIPFPAPNEQGFKTEEEARAFAQSKAENALQEIIDSRLSGLEKVRFAICSGGSAGRLIVEVARKEHANLIVIGTHGLTGLRLLVLGSVTREVMHLADCPVMTVHPGANNFAADEGPLKVLCPTDFSDPSLQALSVAGEFGEAVGAEISVLHVMKPAKSEYTEMSIREFEQLRIDTAKQAMGPLISTFLPAPLQEFALANRQARVGKAAPEIVRLAKEGDFDLIVMATLGETGWRNLFAGSVTEEVVRTATCAVLTIGHGARQHASSADVARRIKRTAAVSA